MIFYYYILGCVLTNFILFLQRDKLRKECTKISEQDNILTSNAQYWFTVCFHTILFPIFYFVYIRFYVRKIYKKINSK